MLSLFKENVQFLFMVHENTCLWLRIDKQEKQTKDWNPKLPKQQIVCFLFVLFFSNSPLTFKWFRLWLPTLTKSSVQNLRGYYHTEFDTRHFKFNNIQENDGPKQEIRFGWWPTPNILKALCFPSCPYNNTCNNLYKIQRNWIQTCQENIFNFLLLLWLKFDQSPKLKDQNSI